jgi:hypothetical protein
MVLGAIVGVPLVTDAVCVRDGGSFILGALGFRCRWRLGGGGAVVVASAGLLEVSTWDHWIVSLPTGGTTVPFIGCMLLIGCMLFIGCMLLILLILPIPWSTGGTECTGFSPSVLDGGGTLAFGLLGPRFRFTPPGGGPFEVTALGDAVLPCCNGALNASRTARSSGLSSSSGGAGAGS